tara:strand:- start:514 stop:675 length:162 start_codon:yes stop_codon:yes gene_type:complete
MRKTISSNPHRREAATKLKALEEKRLKAIEAQKPVPKKRGRKPRKKKVVEEDE